MRPLTPERLRHLLYAAALLALLLYGLYEARGMIAGPQIVIESPQNGATVTESRLIVTGVAKRISAISVNDRQMFIDEAGRFEEALLLLPGYNILVINAEDSYGRETRASLEVVYQP